MSIQAPVSLGEVEADAISTGQGMVPVIPCGPFTLQASDTSDAGTYDETATVKGSVDGTTWSLLATFTAGGDKAEIQTPWQYVQLYQSTGGGTAGRKLTVKMLVLE